MGDVSNYDPDVVDIILERLSKGETLKSICRTAGMPAESTVRKWALVDREGFSVRYREARDLGLDAMADELMDISDDGRNDWVERLNYNGGTPEMVVNGEHINRSRLRVDTRKWYLSKLAPKRYGEKIDHQVSGPDGGPVQQSVTVKFVKPE